MIVLSIRVGRSLGLLRRESAWLLQDTGHTPMEAPRFEPALESLPGKTF
jgi:hypothetical protein